MDDRDANLPRSALRHPFIHTANALASLYKQSVNAERDARDAGSRAAYQNILQWAARKSRNEEPVSAADIISLCATELANLPPPPPPPPSTPPHYPSDRGSQHRLPSALQRNSTPDVTSNPPGQNQNQNQNQTHAPQAVAYIARDESLLSDIRKLNVNPRKRQRVEISDTFISACNGVDNTALIFSDEYGCALRSPDRATSPSVMQTDHSPRQQSAHPSKKEGRDNKDSHSLNNDHPSSRKAKNSKSNYDKLRKK